MSAAVAVLISGRGSNFLALHAAMERGEVPATIHLVVSNIPDAPGLRRAHSLKIPAISIEQESGESREAHEERILRELDRAEIEWICLAGYMRILSPSFVARFPERILNVHPSLLPAFPGLDAQDQASNHGVKIAGCTVHFVDEFLDHGPIVEQRAIRCNSKESADSLSARILEEEHQAYPKALGRLLEERWRIEGRKVIFLD